jgi:hypothetical protein
MLIQKCVFELRTSVAKTCFCLIPIIVTMNVDHVGHVFFIFSFCTWEPLIYPLCLRCSLEFWVKIRSSGHQFLVSGKVDWSKELHPKAWNHKISPCVLPRDLVTSVLAENLAQNQAEGQPKRSNPASFLGQPKHRKYRTGNSLSDHGRTCIKCLDIIPMLIGADLQNVKLHSHGCGLQGFGFFHFMTSSVVSGRDEAEKVRSQGIGKKIQELSLDT